MWVILRRWLCVIALIAALLVPAAVFTSCSGFRATIVTLGLFGYEGRYVSIEGYRFLVHHDHFGYYVVFRGVDYYITFDGSGNPIAPLALIVLLRTL